jgi:hypothetical protein
LTLYAHKALQVNLLDLSPKNGTWNLYCNFASKFFYHNETSTIEIREILLRWQQQSDIDKITQTSSSDKNPLHVWSLGDTKHFEENQNVLFMNKNARQDFYEKINIRVFRLRFLDYASLYFDHYKMKIRDSNIMCIFIS